MKKITERRIPAMLLMLAVLALSACQSTMNRVNDCKTGDWQLIGKKDGGDGLVQQFEDRKRFCSFVDSDKIREESAIQYAQGWVLGNQQFWFQLGRVDGRTGLGVVNYQQQLKSEKVIENKTPLNPAYYEQGWQQGNHEYWYQTGFDDGKAGKTAAEEQSRARTGAEIGFRQASYRQGWQDGNYKYWENLGYQDAHDGIPDSQLSQHLQAAKEKDLLARPEAYRIGWDREIIEYWRQLGWTDAVSGRDVNTRRDDAKRRGLKFLEAEYRQKWEQRLIEYWTEVGAADGFGQPFQLEQRMASARSNNVFVIAQTRDAYTQAWQKQNAAYCTVDNAFEWGRQSKGMAVEVCQPAMQGRLQRALMSGRDFEQLARRHESTHRDLRDHERRARDVERQLNQVEAEIKKNREDKNRQNTQENQNIDNRNERNKNDLRDQLQSLRRRIDDLRSWEFRYQQQMDSLRRDIYL